MRELDTGLELLDHVPGKLAIGLHQSVHLVVWCTVATRDLIRRVDQTKLQLNERFPAGASSLHVLTEAVGLPSRQIRGELAKSIQSLDARLIGSAIVVIGSGFLGSAILSSVTSVRLLVKRGCPTAVHGDIIQATQWLAECHAQRGQAPVLPERLQAATRVLIRAASRTTPAPIHREYSPW